MTKPDRSESLIDGRLRCVWSPSMTEPTVFEIVGLDDHVQARGNIRVIGMEMFFEPLVPQG